MNALDVSERKFNWCYLEDTKNFRRGSIVCEYVEQK